jgi:hypothetical protein
MVAAPDGTLFIGTGNEGKVFRVDPQARARCSSTARTGAHALALAPNGGLTSVFPDGKIYRVERNGTWTTFFNSEDTHLGARGTPRATSTPVPATRASSTRSH